MRLCQLQPTEQKRDHDARESHVAIAPNDVAYQPVAYEKVTYETSHDREHGWITFGALANNPTNSRKGASPGHNMYYQTQPIADVFGR